MDVLEIEMEVDGFTFEALFDRCFSYMSSKLANLIFLPNVSNFETMRSLGIDPDKLSIDRLSGGSISNIEFGFIYDKIPKIRFVSDITQDEDLIIIYTRNLSIMIRLV